MTDLRKAAEQALEDICGAKLCEVNSMSSRAEMLRLMDKAAEALRQALAEPEQEWDSRHPKAQALIRERARLRIELGLVEQLVDDPYFETMPTDMEYWGPLHDKLKEALTQPVDTVNMSQERVDETAKGEHEPVAFVTGYFGGHLTITCFDPALVLPDGLALYTAPPKREWVGLTDEDLSVCDEDGVLLARYWEAKLKEKNT